jgi:hypothetical protein
MAASRVLYAFFDGDVMVYVGQSNNLASRHWLHRRDATDKTSRLYRRWRELETLGRSLTLRVLAVLPDCRCYVGEMERDMIAKVGLIEDGGTLLNMRRSSLPHDPAGYPVEATEKMSAKAKAWRAANREALIAKHRQIGQQPEYRAAQATKQREIWARPGEREARLAKQHSAEVQATRAAEMKRRWADPAFKAKMAKRKPSTWTDERRASHAEKCRATLARNKG